MPRGRARAVQGGTGKTEHADPVGRQVQHERVDFISLVRHYQDFKKNVHGFVESCESVVSRLHPLCVGNLGRMFDQSKEGFSVQDLFAPVLFVMDLSSLKYEPAKNLLSQILLK